MEELQLVLAALAQLGDAAKEGFIWWLIFDKGLSMVVGITAILSVANVGLTIIRGVQNNEFLKDIYEHFYGSRPYSMSDADMSAIRRKLTEHK